MHGKSLDLMLVAILAAAAAAIPILGIHPVGIRAVLAIPLVLVLPGYAVSAALFAGSLRRSRGRIPFNPSDPPARLAIVIGASLTITALGGLLLNSTSGGLRTDSWAILLASVTLLAAAVAAVRRGRRVGITQERSPSEQTLRLRRRDGLTFGVAVLIAGVAIILATTSALQQGNAAVTQFWLLPASTAQTVRIGAMSTDSIPHLYGVRLTVGTQVVRDWPPFLLKPGHAWHAVQTVPPASSGVVEARLYRLDRPGVAYRYVRLGASPATSQPVDHGISVSHAAPATRGPVR